MAREYQSGPSSGGLLHHHVGLDGVVAPEGVLARNVRDGDVVEDPRPEHEDVSSGWNGGRPVGRDDGWIVVVYDEDPDIGLCDQPVDVEGGK
ncbi:MAG: hypothetical protein GWN18_17900 [Thermoplasmata archaeon]|nr:hypothetical protein [Thermoplasmata archaeon]NIS13999.1 hypothetical protein [Thermoplasmata archaeon]NIS21831.1 hypothetical protein [Thermoplasmata archaeon]NIT79436.1 hypothetical protein [Thermoplasmata archaeon]NIU50868.1 hypothetical protein [Thermoplasmata archaeon]